MLATAHKTSSVGCNINSGAQQEFSLGGIDAAHAAGPSLKSLDGRHYWNAGWRLLTRLARGDVGPKKAHLHDETHIWRRRACCRRGCC